MKGKFEVYRGDLVGWARPPITSTRGEINPHFVNQSSPLARALVRRLQYSTDIKDLPETWFPPCFVLPELFSAPRGLCNLYADIVLDLFARNCSHGSRLVLRCGRRVQI